MKSIILTLGMVLAGLAALWAQPNPNDLHVSGYVTDANGNAVSGQWVCVVYYGSNTSIADSVCANTNANGWYSIVVTNGSMTGPNQVFDVYTTEYCQNTAIYHVDTVENGQGSIDTVSVDFAFGCGNSGGCNCSASITSVLIPNLPPLGEAYEFAADVSCGSAPFQYQWWIDGQQYTSATPTYEFTDDGAYGVCVTIADANGCSFTACDTIFVGNTSCAASWYYSSNPNGGIVAGVDNPFYFSGSASNTSNFYWQVQGNGLSMTSDQMNPSFNFPSAGTYNVCLYLVDSTTMCSDQFCADVVVSGGNSGGCQAYFTVTDSSGYSYFIDLSQGNATSWSWNFGDGNFSTQQYPWHQYAQPGAYAVCLTITDSGNPGCSDSYCDSVYVGMNNGDTCVAQFTYTQNPNDSSLFTFAALGQNNQPAQYVWDFGDGSTGSGAVVTHNFGGGQSWEWVCLTVYGSNNCQVSYCDTIWVGSGNTGNCNASFTNSGSTPIGYTFSADMQSNNYNYVWSIDGQPGNNGGYDFYVPGFAEGTHSVCLTISDGVCSDSYCETFVVGPDSICNGMLSGQVFAGTLNQPVDQAIVYLITYDNQSGLLAAMQATVVDSMGYYFFQDVPCGDYLIKAATTNSSTFYSDYLPTYYGNSLFWEYAQTVGVDEIMPAVQYDITLIAGNNPGGPGFIGGNVTDGANKMASGEPIEGVNVMLFDMVGNPIAYTYTDANGAFGFSGLPYGTYQVYAELINYSTDVSIVTINEETPMEEGVSIFVTDDLEITGVTESDFESMVGDIFPNPVTDRAFVTFDIEGAYQATLDVVDLTGRTVSSEAVNLQTGKNMLTLETNGLVDGYYLLSISDRNGEFRVTRRFVVNR